MSMLNMLQPVWALPALDSLARALSRKIRPGSRRMPSLYTDRTTGLFNSLGMATLGATIVDNCRREQQQVSLVVVRIEDLSDLRDIFGGRLYREAMFKIGRSLERVVPLRGMVARTGRTEFALLAPRLSRCEALALLTRSLGTPPRFEFTLGGTEMILVPEVAAEVIPKDVSITKAHDQLLRSLEVFSESERARLEAMTMMRECYARL